MSESWDEVEAQCHEAAEAVAAIENRLEQLVELGVIHTARKRFVVADLQRLKAEFERGGRVAEIFAVMGAGDD